MLATNPANHLVTAAGLHLPTLPPWRQISTWALEMANHIQIIIVPNVFSSLLNIYYCFRHVEYCKILTVSTAFFFSFFLPEVPKLERSWSGVFWLSVQDCLTSAEPQPLNFLHYFSLPDGNNDPYSSTSHRCWTDWLVNVQKLLWGWKVPIIIIIMLSKRDSLPLKGSHKTVIDV